MDNEKQAAAGGLPTRWPELLVALFLFGLGLIVVTDSLRVGIDWADDGPRAGYFPFYIGLILALSSAYVAIRTLTGWRGDARVFATWTQLRDVVLSAVPLVVYVGLVVFLGIYVASTLFIAYFMVRHGDYSWLTTAAVSLGVPLVFFVVFERWFLVPLPKGPIERMLGF